MSPHENAFDYVFEEPPRHLDAVLVISRLEVSVHPTGLTMWAIDGRPLDAFEVHVIENATPAAWADAESLSLLALELDKRELERLKRVHYRLSEGLPAEPDDDP